MKAAMRVGPLLREVFATERPRSNRAHTALMIVRDALVVLLATGAAFLLRFEFHIPHSYCPYIIPAALFCAVLFPLLFHRMGLYRYIWRYVGVDSFVHLAGATAAGVAILAGLVATGEAVSGLRPLPYSVVALFGIVGYLGFVADRAAGRVQLYFRSRTRVGERVLIVGAGDAGSLLLNDMERNPGLGFRVVGFLDDDPDKQGRLMRTARVIGTTAQLGEVVKRERVDAVFVAVPSADSETARMIIYRCGKAGVPARIVPALAAQRRAVTLDDLEPVDYGRFLGRDPVEADTESMRASIEGKTVLVTGASGSIGSELCRQVVRLHPERLILFELDESRLYETYLELMEHANGARIEMALGDVRNIDKVRRVMGRQHIDLVIHAAAYKHVPLMELEPDEAVRTNVLGTKNVIDVSCEQGVDRFLLISTDKAVTPTSVMGLTKAIAERLSFEEACAGLHVTVVRFGNVLGSRGSVIPLFEQKLDRGEPVQVTDPDVDRYFMTIPEAAQLVLQAQAMSGGSDLYILDMGEPVRILDLACAIIQQRGETAEVRFSGLRPAEKMHEELVHADTHLECTDCDKVMRSDVLPNAGEHFRELVPELIAAAEDDDRDRMQRLMVALCPDFAGEVASLSGAS